MTLRISYVLLSLKRAWRLVNCKRGVPDAPELCARRKKVFEENFVYKLITGRIRLLFKIPSKDSLYKTRTRILYDHKNVSGFQLNNIY